MGERGLAFIRKLVLRVHNGVQSSCVTSIPCAFGDVCTCGKELPKVLQEALAIPEAERVVLKRTHIVIGFHERPSFLVGSVDIVGG